MRAVIGRLLLWFIAAEREREAQVASLKRMNDDKRRARHARYQAAMEGREA